MSTAITLIMFGIQMIPAILRSARELQQSLPDGTGPTKLQIFTEVVKAIFTAAPEVEKAIPQNKAIAIVTGSVNAVVGILKPLGLLGNAPTTPTADTPSVAPAATKDHDPFSKPGVPFGVATPQSAHSIASTTAERLGIVGGDKP